MGKRIVHIFEISEAICSVLYKSNTEVKDPSILTGFATLLNDVGYLCPQCALLKFWYKTQW